MAMLGAAGEMHSPGRDTAGGGAPLHHRPCDDDDGHTGAQAEAADRGGPAVRPVQHSELQEVHEPAGRLPVQVAVSLPMASSSLWKRRKREDGRAAGELLESSPLRQETGEEEYDESRRPVAEPCGTFDISLHSMASMRNLVETIVSASPAVDRGE